VHKITCKTQLLLKLRTINVTLTIFATGFTSPFSADVRGKICRFPFHKIVIGTGVFLRQKFCQTYEELGGKAGRKCWRLAAIYGLSLIGETPRLCRAGSGGRVRVAGVAPAHASRTGSGRVGNVTPRVAHPPTVDARRRLVELFGARPPGECVRNQRWQQSRRLGPEAEVVFHASTRQRADGAHELDANRPHRRQRRLPVAQTSAGVSGWVGTGRKNADVEVAVQHPGRAASADRKSGQRRGETGWGEWLAFCGDGCRSTLSLRVHHLHCRLNVRHSIVGTFVPRTIMRPSNSGNISKLMIYGVAQKVSHYQKSSLNRIKNRQCGYISHRFWA